MGMEELKKIRTKEGVLVKTPGMVAAKKLEIQFDEASKRQGEGLQGEEVLIKRAKSPKEKIDTVETKESTRLIKREQARKDSAAVETLKGKIGDALLVKRPRI